AGITEALAQAQAIARLQPEDPECPEPPAPPHAPSAPTPVPRATVACDALCRAQAAETLCGKAAGAGLTASGSFSTKVAELAVANSRGLFAYTPRLQARLSAVV